ncbi:MAG: hypothetical protein IIY33_04095 [Erysipelotrichaceae bacterium]|nr:hypothetical protein [Erysipelotrichaceae bacterium]
MSLFWYPEINEKYAFDDMPDKGMLLSSYIRYYLSRLQSMFKYEGLPESIPAKWLENYLLVNGFTVFIKDGDDIICTYAGVGADPDVYFIPTKAIVSNPYLKHKSAAREYTRDVDCVVMYNDTYCQGLLPMLKKYCAQMVEIDVSFYLNTVMSRGTAVLSATDDNTKASAELWLKHIKEGKLGVIGESNFTLADRDLTVNQLTGTDGTLTNLIEAMQYVKASLYNDLGLQANYNMKREAINAGESQLTEDQLHPLIDNMLKERQEGLDRVNKMFGTNITVSFNSAWEINEREEEAAIEQIEATTEQTEAAAEMTEEAPVQSGDETVQNGSEEVTEDITTNEDIPEEASTEEVTEEDATEEEAPEVEVTISDDAIEEIAEKVADKLEGEDEDEADKEQSDN